MSDEMGTVECEECRENVRWVGTVRVQAVRGNGIRPVRVCRNCAGRALLPPTLPPRDARTSPANWRWLYRAKYTLPAD